MYAFILIANTIGEWTYGIFILVVAPLSGLDHSPAEPWFRHFGIASLVMGVLSLLMLFFKGKDGYLMGLTALSLYHLGLTASEALSLPMNLYGMPLLAFHGVLGALFLWATLQAVGKRRK